MRIYRLVNQDSTGYLLSEETVPKVLNANESPRSISARWCEKKSDYKPDIVRLYSGWPNMAFSARVREQLEGSEHAIGEWSQINVDDTVLWLFHSTLVVDALDESLSEIKRLPSGHISPIRIHVFKPELVPKNRLFMLKTRPYDLLCSDEFVDKVSEFDWKGFMFEPVWDSNFEPFPDGPYRRELLARPEIYGPDGIVKGYEGSWPEEWKK